MAGDRVVLVFAGGDAIPLAITDLLEPDAFVIAADSGLDQAGALGWKVDLVVGDLDSVSAVALEEARDAGVAIEQHPAAKDETDLELALDAALDQGATRIVVVGGHGGRLDHLLANALLMASPAYAAAQMDGYGGTARVHVVHDDRSLHATPGETCTLLPVHGAAEGVRTEGLRWSLAGETLDPGTSRGVSNIVEASTIRIRVDQGVVLAVFPGDLAAGD